MTLKTAKLLVRHSDGRLELKESYSGRGMYGERCSGVVFESYNDLIFTVVYAAGSLQDHEDYDDFIDEVMNGFSYDSLGLDKIAY